MEIEANNSELYDEDNGLFHGYGDELWVYEEEKNTENEVLRYEENKVRFE